MKKILNIIIMSAASVLLARCGGYDDSALRDRIDGYKERIEAMRTKIESLQREIDELSLLTSGNVITSVTQDADGRYVITYRDAKDKEHTVVLAARDDIIEVPVIGVEADENGVYYWTTCLNGERSWLTDGAGNRFPVSGYTPTISVDAEGYWTVDGRRLLDAAGQPVKAGDGATSLFRAAELDGAGNFVLTLGDGTVVTLPVFDSVNLKLSAAPVTELYDLPGTMQVTYELTGEARDRAVVALAKAEGLEASLDRDAKRIDLSFGSDFTAGTLIVMAYDLADNVVVRPLFFRRTSDEAPRELTISSAEELKVFAAQVNAGGAAARATVKLTADIDMAGVTEWTPIGAATFTFGSNVLTVTGGNPFRGHFDGQNHTIKNFKLRCAPTGSDCNAAGLFGAIAGGAVVENLRFDEGCSMTVAAQTTADCGLVAGLVCDATVRNIESRASLAITAEASSPKARMTMGLVGFAFAEEEGVTIDRCVNRGTVTAENGGNTENGAAGVQVGGILGFGTNKAALTITVKVSNCENYAPLDTKVPRAAGIVAAANRYTVISDCTNYAANTNSFPTSGGSRIGNITCITGAGSALVRCVNRGDLICTTAGRAGGLVSLVNDKTNSFVCCENYGRVITDDTTNRGTIFGVCNQPAEFQTCVAQGDVGAYDGGSYRMVGVTAENYFSHIGAHNDKATNVTPANIVWEK